MKQYEIMVIYNTDLGDQGARDLSKKVQEIITAQGAKVVKNDFWGKRKFSYEIKHKTEGYYEVMQLETEVENIIKIKTKLNQLTGLVRYLITA